MAKLSLFAGLFSIFFLLHNGKGVGRHPLVPRFR